MTKRVIIDPVSRIEGHAKITIYLLDSSAKKPAATDAKEVKLELTIAA